MNIGHLTIKHNERIPSVDSVIDRIQSMFKDLDRYIQKLNSNVDDDVGCIDLYESRASFDSYYVVFETLDTDYRIRISNHDNEDCNSDFRFWYSDFENLSQMKKAIKAKVDEVYKSLYKV